MSTIEPPRRTASRHFDEPQSRFDSTEPARCAERHSEPAFVAGWPLLGPIVGLTLLTWIFRTTNLDLWISSWFYDPQSQSWPWFYSLFCTAFYRGGIYPAFGLGLGGIAVGLWGLLAPQRRWYALRAGTFLWVVFLVGPGILVNVALKNSLGRPRPHQVELFGGPHQFVPVLTPSAQEPHNASFPSGHAAVAFFLMAPAFLVERRRPRLARGLFAAGLAFGAAMSAVRVIQGGHFASDVVWSAALVYLTCVACARVILNPRRTTPVRGRHFTAATPAAAT